MSKQILTDYSAGAGFTFAVAPVSKSNCGELAADGEHLVRFQLSRCGTDRRQDTLEANELWMAVDAIVYQLSTLIGRVYALLDTEDLAIAESLEMLGLALRADELRGAARLVEERVRGPNAAINFQREKITGGPFR